MGSSSFLAFFNASLAACSLASASLTMASLLAPVPSSFAILLGQHLLFLSAVWNAGVASAATVAYGMWSVQWGLALNSLAERHSGLQVCTRTNAFLGTIVK